MESALEAGCYILNGYEHSELDRLVKCVFIVELKFPKNCSIAEDEEWHCRFFAFEQCMIRVIPLFPDSCLK